MYEARNTVPRSENVLCVRCHDCLLIMFREINAVYDDDHIKTTDSFDVHNAFFFYYSSA